MTGRFDRPSGLDRTEGSRQLLLGRLLIGADVGGTSTRLALADPSGRVLARSHQPAGNPNAVGVELSAQRIRAGIDALAIPPGSRIGAVVLGMAGFTTAIRAGAEFTRTAIPDGLGVRPRIVSDLAVAFASATPLPRGTVVIAGTGSGAALIDSGEIVARRGAWGWLLGDEGAGFWLGREAVRHTLTAVEREQTRVDREAYQRPSGSAGRGLLAQSVIERLGADPADPLPDLVRIPYLGPAARLADLAPLVTELADRDRAAAAICSEAAGRLADLVGDLRPAADRPVVVGGAVLQTPGPIRSDFVDQLRRRRIGPVLDVRSGLVGALWLALATDADGRPTAAPVDDTSHAEFLSTIG